MRFFLPLLLMLGLALNAADQKPLVINPTTGKQEQLQAGNNLVTPASSEVKVGGALEVTGDTAGASASKAAIFFDGLGTGTYFVSYGSGIGSVGSMTLRGSDSSGGTSLTYWTLTQNYNETFAPTYFPAATVNGPSIRLPHGVAPSVPTNGDMWTTTSGLFAYINGSTVGLGGGISGTLTSGRVPYANGASSLTDSAKMVYSDTTGFNVNLASSGANNLTLGTGAGDSLTTAAQSTAIGVNALSAVSGSNSTAVGYTALQSNTGQFNTAIGSLAGAPITSATGVTLVGYNAGGVGGGGSDSTGVGIGALSANTASGTTAVGAYALDSNTSGTGNTAVGRNALTVVSTTTNNTALGDQAGDALSTGNNTAVGKDALGAASGGDATAVGYQALLLNTAANNTAVGSSAGDAITSGTGLTAVGKDALGATTGNNNTGIGLSAGLGIVTGTDNTVIGASAASSGISSGTHNTVIGSNATVGTTLSSNTVIGADASITTIGSTECILIGRGATYNGGAAGKLIIGGNTFEILDVWIGEGENNASPQPVTFGNTAAAGTNIAGADLTIRAGAGTGTGVGGSLIIQTAPAVASGATPGTQVNAGQFDASTTAGQTRFLLYDVDNGTLERVTVGAADSGGAGFKVLRIPN